MMRESIYHSIYTGKPPDEPAMLGLAMNELFVPLLQLPAGGGADQKGVFRLRAARHVWPLEPFPQ